ncbi:MAG: CARDB domain-containing protein, partial [Patescibacteria group bacterium]
MSPDTSGSGTGAPTVTTTYQYNCRNGNGTTNRSVTVTVLPVVPPAATVSSFAAAPTSITSGGSSTLTWSSSNATSCTSGNFATGGLTSGSVSVSPTTTTTYSMSCTGAGGPSAMSYATVTVTGTKDLVASAITPTTATVGTSVNISATIANNGTASTGTSFTNNFQRATSAAGAGATSIGTFVSGIPSGFPAGYSEPNAQVSHTFPSAGTWYVRACADSTGAITESNESNNCSAWTAVTVSAPAAPNLTAGSVTPTSVTVGTPVTLSSTITNDGAVTTGAGFTNLFQRATDASGTGSTDIGTHASAVLASSGSNAATLSYTFPSAATWYVRACADKNSAAGTGTITETSEADNCSAWTAVTATGPTAPNLTAGAVTPTVATLGTAV